jgi:hypothetical protein
MVQSYIVMDKVTKGNSCRVTEMVMEYIDIRKEIYIMDNKKRIKKMAMDNIIFKMAVNIMDSSRMIFFMEML